MDVFFMFLGLLAIAIWVYSVVIVIRKTQDTTWYEKTALIVGLVMFILMLIGASSS